MSTIRIGDITNDPKEQEQLQKVVNLLEGIVSERAAEFGQKAEEAAERVVQRALQKEREYRLPETEPKRQALDVMGEIRQMMLTGHGGVSAIRALREKYPAMYGDMSDADITRAFQRATMTTGSAGMSYVLPAPVWNEIQTYARETVELLGLVRHFPVPEGSGISGSIPVGTSTRPTCYIANEATAPTDSVIQPGTFSYSLLRFAVGIPLSNQLYQMSIPAFAAWINEEAGYALAIKQYSQMAVGTNSNQWQGLETAAITEVTTGDTDFDKIIRTFFAVPAYHRTRGVWVCNEVTLAALAVLKDGSGRYILNTNEEVVKLYGRPVYTNSAHTDGRVYFGDPTRYIIAEGGYKTATITFGNGYTMTSQDSTYVYIGQDLDGGVSDTNAWRYCIISV